MNKAEFSLITIRFTHLAKPLNRVKPPASTWKNCKVATLFY